MVLERDTEDTVHAPLSSHRSGEPRWIEDGPIVARERLDEGIHYDADARQRRLGAREECEGRASTGLVLTKHHLETSASKIVEYVPRWHQAQAIAATKELEHGRTRIRVQPWSDSDRA